MDYKELTYFLDGVFTTSFKHTAYKHYDVYFQDSNVMKTVDRLNKLYSNIESGNKNDVNVGYSIKLNDVKNVIEILDYLVIHYKDINQVNYLPSYLKIYELQAYIRSYYNQQDIKSIVKEITKEVFTPTTKVIKGVNIEVLTPTQILAGRILQANKKDKKIG